MSTSTTTDNKHYKYLYEITSLDSADTTESLPAVPLFYVARQNDPYKDTHF